MHLKQREGERGIVRRQLQSCLKYGKKRRTRADKWEVEHEGITLVTDDSKKIGVTAFWSGLGSRPEWAESMEEMKRKDERLLREGSTSVFFPFDLSESSEPLPPLPESPRGTPRSDLGSFSHASPRSEPESPRSAAPSRSASASREPSHSRATGGGGGPREGGGGWPGTAVATETLYWRDTGGDGAGGGLGGLDELRFAPGLDGAIFMTNAVNQEECLRRGLFGAPKRQACNHSL